MAMKELAEDVAAQAKLAVSRLRVVNSMDAVAVGYHVILPEVQRPGAVPLLVGQRPVRIDAAKTTQSMPLRQIGHRLRLGGGRLDHRTHCAIALTNRALRSGSPPPMSR